MDGLAIETEQLRKRYGAFEAVRGVDLKAPTEIFSLFENAAGKSIERKYGFEKSFKLSKYEFVLGMAFGVFGAKAESVGLKFEAVGAAFEGKATKVKDVKAKLDIDLEEAILGAGWDQLLEAGYNAFTIEAVAERAGTMAHIM